MARERVEFDVVGRDVGGSKTFRDLADSAEKAGDKVDDLGDELRQLDRQVLESKAAMMALAHEIDRTGNRDLIKDFRKQRSQLRQLLDVKKVMQEVGEDGADSFGTSFLTRVGPLVMRGAPSALGPVALAFGAPLAAGAAMVVATAVGGAIVGAAGAGGVAGGLLVASKHSAVKSAAEALGAEVMSALQESAAGFVPATIKSIGIIRAEFASMRGDLDRLFGASAPFLETLTHGAAEGIHSIVDGLTNAAERAGPVIDVIASEMRLLGDAIGDGFNMLSDNAESGARALAILFEVVNFGVRAFFALTNAAAETFGWLEKIGVFGVSAAIEAWSQDADKAADSTGGFSEELKGLLSGFQETAPAVAAAQTPVTDMGTAMHQAGFETGYFAEALERLNGDLAGIEQAQADVEAAIDNATDAIKNNGKTLDESTPKGRANAAALRELSTAAKSSAERVFDAKLATGDYTGAQEAANTILQKAKDAYIKNMTAITGNRTEAKRLADQIFGTPKQWKTTFDAATEAASAKITGLQKQVRDLHGKTITITTRFVTTGRNPGEHIVGGIGAGTQVKNSSMGGPVFGPGPKGVDSVLHRLAPGEHVFTASEVDAMGGQARVLAFRRSLHSSGGPSPSPPTGGRGSDGVRPADMVRSFEMALERVLARATLRISDQTAQFSDLLVRGG